MANKTVITNIVHRQVIPRPTRVLIFNVYLCSGQFSRPLTPDEAAVRSLQCLSVVDKLSKLQHALFVFCRVKFDFVLYLKQPKLVLERKMSRTWRWRDQVNLLSAPDITPNVSRLFELVFVSLYFFFMSIIEGIDFYPNYILILDLLNRYNSPYPDIELKYDDQLQYPPNMVTDPGLSPGRVTTLESENKLSFLPSAWCWCWCSSST